LGQQFVHASLIIGTAVLKVDRVATVEFAPRDLTISSESITYLNSDYVPRV
jgi:hypothetical protein